MNDVAISVKNVSKCFEMYEKPVHRLYQTLFAGKKKFYKEFWALKDINFEVRKGECVGIIGRNGAGKSTLLQIITGTLAPTTGEVKVNGRIAALLELGSGFNPEFTGRENVYLNGSILGLSREEIDARYDDILAFADIGEFINQPVKTYSSGMMVRLAFAVNVFVDPEVLIVDEALAVGDAAFQLKCANRMKDLRAKGVTILFVTHDITSVRTFCDSAVWLDKGIVQDVGDVRSITTAYMQSLFGPDDPAHRSEPKVLQSATFGEGKVVVADQPSIRRWGSGEVLVESFTFSAFNHLVEYGELLSLTVRIRVIRDFVTQEGIACAFSIRNRKALDIVCCTTADEKLQTPKVVNAGEVFEASFKWHNDLKADEYTLVIAVENRGDEERRYCDYLENALQFKTCECFPMYALTRPKCEIALRMEGPKIYGVE